MGNTVTFAVKGLDELQRKLETEVPVVGKGIVKEGLQAGGQRFVWGIAREAPKDTYFLTEHINLKTRVYRGDNLAGTAFAGPSGKIDYPFLSSPKYKKVKTKKGRNKRVGRIAVASVARFLQFGTSKMKANEFMTRGFEREKGNALTAVIGVITNALRKLGHP